MGSLLNPLSHTTKHLGYNIWRKKVHSHICILVVRAITRKSERSVGSQSLSLQRFLYQLLHLPLRCNGYKCHFCESHQNGQE